jgi:hypothetical protein
VVDEFLNPLDGISEQNPVGEAQPAKVQFVNANSFILKLACACFDSLIV